MVITIDEADRVEPSALVVERDSSGRSHLGSAPSSSSGYDCWRLALASVRGRVSGMPWAMNRVHLEDPWMDLIVTGQLFLVRVSLMTSK